jgi:hypothetical protein
MTVGEFVNLSKRKSIDSAIDILFGRQTPVTVDLDGWDMNIVCNLVGIQSRNLHVAIFVVASQVVQLS